MKLIAVAGDVAVEREAIAVAFERCFEAWWSNTDVEVVGSACEVQRGRGPMNDELCRAAALNRLEKVAAEKPLADYWVAVESGFQFRSYQEVFAFLWVALRGPHGVVTTARSGSVSVPRAVAMASMDGREIGAICHQYWNVPFWAVERVGLVGFATFGRLNQPDWVRDTTIMALGAHLEESIQRSEIAWSKVGEHG